MAEDLTDWVKGDPLAAAHLQQGVSAIRSLLNVPGAGQSHIKADRGVWRFAIRVGIIVNTGPASEADYTDERYWVQDVSLDSTGTIDSQVTFTPIAPQKETMNGRSLDKSFSTSVTVPTTFTVTNLPELVSHSHSQQVGNYVWYFTLVDGQDNPVSHCVMSEGGTGTEVMYVVSGTARGKYAVSIQTPTSSDISSSDDISTTSIFGSTTVSAIGCNLLEITDDIPLRIGGFYLCKYWKTNSDRTRVYVSHGFDVEDCPS